MEGVTTAIVAFIFVGILFPRIIKVKAQFYGALAAVLLIILLYALAMAIDADHDGFDRFAAVMIGLLQIGAIFLLILSAGGLTVKDLAGDLSEAIEVMRRGGDKKTYIVPLTGAQPKARAGTEDEGWTDVSSSSSATAAPGSTTTTSTPPPPRNPRDASIPME
jgi:hypothetical protein